MNPDEIKPRQVIGQILAQTGNLTEQALDHALFRISAILSMNFRDTNSLNPWFRNAIVKKQIENILREYTGQVVRLTENQTRKIWELTEEKNDQMVIGKLLEATGATIFIGKLYKYLNRLIPEKTDPRLSITVTKEAVEQVLKSPRNTQALNAFLNRKVDGLNLSARVWRLTDETVQPLIESFLTQGIESGTPAATISRDMKQYLREPNKLFRRVRNKETGKLELSSAAKDYHPGQGVYRSSHMNARRLASNEILLAYRAADHERWASLDFIRGIKIPVSESHGTRMPDGDICDQLQGNYPKEFFFTGWHPICRCYASSITLPKEDFIKRLMGDPIEVKPVDIPSEFKQYLKDNQERIEGWKSTPYWIKYNKSTVDYILKK